MKHKRRWTKTEDKQLWRLVGVDCAGFGEVARIARKLNRTRSAVSQRLDYLRHNDLHFRIVTIEDYIQNINDRMKAMEEREITKKRFWFF